jgi:hypothetical protein
LKDKISSFPPPSARRTTPLTKSGLPNFIKATR